MLSTGRGCRRFSTIDIIHLIQAIEKSIVLQDGLEILITPEELRIFRNLRTDTLLDFAADEVDELDSLQKVQF